MSNLQTIKYATKSHNLHLRVATGHFATNSLHSNYYIDVAAQKSRVSEAKAVAEELSSYYYSDTIVDTILCIDGTEVIGAYFADCLTKGDFININAHKTIYVVSPEIVGGNQMIFRDNIVPMIQGKNVMILCVSVSSGKTAEMAVNAVKYYGGTVSGISAIFSTIEKCAGYTVRSVFDTGDLEHYFCAPSHECPLCKAGVKLDALINSHGFSKL